MSSLMSLRLYYHASEKALPTRRLHHFFRPSLTSHLLRHATHGGIEQVLAYHVQAGYLKGKPMAHYHVESAHAHLPQCVEMIDTEQKLRAFLKHHAAHLTGVRAVFLPCEVALKH